MTKEIEIEEGVKMIEHKEMPIFLKVVYTISISVAVTYAMYFIQSSS